MDRRWWLAIALVAAGCSSQPTPAAGALALWDPIDSSFAGCQGACGAHVEGAHADIVAQPGAEIGQRTYCPVSGAVFEVDADHPHADIGGRPLWFCCAGCAEYFEAHRDEVLEARGISAADPSPAPARTGT